MKYIILFILSLFYTNCVRHYIPSSDSQFSCEEKSRRSKVQLVGNDPRHTAYGYCRHDMKYKNWVYNYNGIPYMKVKYHANREIKTSCLNSNSKWFPSTEYECRKIYNH